ncbi:MAG: tRNA uridine-5-carboxymethylaminomethyl(34) synthesis GTPase MnmE [Clostridia bacterium]|nr:tRNA uridine-5-carboxymethylaminomethyl(34) synthesis GTPase MnmE [Clostridia bacterium]
MTLYHEDTIAGISTAAGEGGVAIIRISGPDAAAILCNAFSSKPHYEPSQIPDHLMRYGHVLDQDGSRIDEAMAVLFRAPRSYTREDVAEIHVHGGRVCAERTLMRTVELGARPALPGEFTRRAFENGRIDLTQAEAVMDTIRAEGEMAQRSAQMQLSGQLREQIEYFQDELTYLLAKIDAAADYPDEDLDEETRISCINDFEKISREISSILSRASDARHIREGLMTAIVGAPNAGKSSLLNALLGNDRAIVTPIAGTTRDTIEERFSYKGMVFRLIDTAGLRETQDAIESIGVSKAKEILQEADLVLYVVDAADPASFDPDTLRSVPDGKPTVLLLNKSDLEAKITSEAILSIVPQVEILNICAKTGEGLPSLYEVMFRHAVRENTAAEQLFVSNVRHIRLLSQTADVLRQGLASARQNVPIDFLGIDVQEAWRLLAQITGKTCDENVIDTIFSNFCVGK